MKGPKSISYAKLGYWRIGGVLENFYIVENVSELQKILREYKEITIVGNGSNALMSDQGSSSPCIRLGGFFKEIEVTDRGLRCGAGLKNAIFLNRLKKLELGGFGCLSGVPGTLGGAIRMNAGTSLGEIGERVIEVEWLDAQGEIQVSTKDELMFSYRKTQGLPEKAIVTSILFEAFSRSDPQIEDEPQNIQRHLQRRKETQPLHLPSCGSVFTNPKGDYAGRLIEQAGLKGRIIGGAQISEKHANFIVNLGGASARDVYDLIALCRSEVYEQFSVILHPEVRLVGDWEGSKWPPEIQSMSRDM